MRQITKITETKRLQYHDQKLTDPTIKEEYMEKLKETSQIALEVINELTKTIPQNLGQGQNKADKAFEAVIVAIDTAAQATIGSSMKSVDSQTQRRKSVQPYDPSPEIQQLYSDKIILQRQLTHIRAEPANPTLEQRARDKLLELYANSAEIRARTKENQIKEMLVSLLDSPDGGISHDPKTFGPTLYNQNTHPNPVLPHLHAGTIRREERSRHHGCPVPLDISHPN